METERVHRIDGIKYHTDRLSDSELRGIQGHLLEKHAKLVADIAFVETLMFDRSHEQMELDYGGNEQAV